ncbi:HipA family kinase [Bacillus sp. Marseille-P3661]|uniref:HipA family kinase n=1 Tax=Bacillus sp. Marseille-P3661 TaxID=1936234 RepID=UPI000C81BC4F|nr:HipA family kinase [Bacillus sp. Marseille-P3661]
MINPIAYRKKLEGKSNAHLITFDDGRDYVVKFFQSGFEKSLPNEWVSYCLARYLGLPVPFAKIVEIPQSFTYETPELASMSTTTQSQFVSLFVPDCLDGHQVSTILDITNKELLAGIIVFDYWLCNRDRTRKNILLQEEKQDCYKLWIIDHAETFGSYNWTLSELDHLSTDLMKSATHELMSRFVEDEQYFAKQIELIKAIPIFLIEEIVTLIPDDWMMSKEEKKALVSTLVGRRKEMLSNVIKKFIKKVN